MNYKIIIASLLLSFGAIHAQAGEARVDPEDKAYCEQSAREEQIPADQLAGYLEECLQMLTTNASIDDTSDQAYCEQSAREEQIPSDQQADYVAECLRMLTAPGSEDASGDKGQN